MNEPRLNFYFRAQRLLQMGQQMGWSQGQVAEMLGLFHYREVRNVIRERDALAATLAGRRDRAPAQAEA